MTARSQSLQKKAERRAELILLAIGFGTLLVSALTGLTMFLIEYIKMSF